MVPLIKRSTDSLVAVIGEKATAEVTFDAIEYVCLLIATILLCIYCCIIGCTAASLWRRLSLQHSVVRLICREENRMSSPKPWILQWRNFPVDSLKTSLYSTVCFKYISGSHRWKAYVVRNPVSMLWYLKFKLGIILYTLILARRYYRSYCESILSVADGVIGF